MTGEQLSNSTSDSAHKVEARSAPAAGRTRRNQLHQLDVYRCALDLYRLVRRIVAHFPRGEGDFRSQMRRASRSVPFNIGEGVGKRGRARAAAYEVSLGETKELIVSLDCVEIDPSARRRNRSAGHGRQGSCDVDQAHSTH